MQATRDQETGDFKVTGTDEQIRKLVSVVREEWGDDDLAGEWEQAADAAAGSENTVEVVIPRDAAGEAADLFAYGPGDDEVQNLGTEIEDAIQTFNDSVIAQAQAESNARRES